jgi:hypothetical protein
MKQPTPTGGFGKINPMDVIKYNPAEKIKFVPGVVERAEKEMKKMREGRD